MVGDTVGEFAPAASDQRDSINFLLPSCGGSRLAYADPMLSKQQIADLHFLDARCHLIDLAAFLDRVDRHDGEPDFRVTALREALPLLLADRPDRARAILDALSDPSADPIPAATIQGAFGAPRN